LDELQPSDRWAGPEWFGQMSDGHGFRSFVGGVQRREGFAHSPH
jgi:hypothetical protein